MNDSLPSPASDYLAASDADLLAWFRSGDEAALEALLLRHEKPLFQFLVGMLRDRHQADDALQETWCRALEHLGGVDADHFRGWLFTVAYHQAMLFKRQRKLRFAHSLQTDVADGAPQPESLVQRGEQAQRLRELMNHLPAPQREVIEQRIYEGKRFREIAEFLACPLNTALARMHQGLKKLKVLWGSEHV